MTMISANSMRNGAFALAASLTLSGCFLSPGSFQAAMDIRQNGDFTFTYDGEIFMMGLSDLSEMANQAEAIEPCFDESSFEERSCTDKELDNRRAEQEQQRAMMTAMMGGSDLSDPESAADFAIQLERQAGWDSVEYAGDGLFNVSFSVSSTLTHDFVFPVFESSPMSNSFVTANLRDGSRVRVEALGFAAQGGSPLQAMMGGMAGAFSGFANIDSVGDEGTPPASSPMSTMPQMEGIFRITTNAQILTNNTDEGPINMAGGQSLEWQISLGNNVAPTAMFLISQ